MPQLSLSLINEKHFFETDKISFIDDKTNDSLLRSQLEENDICYSIAGSLDKFTLVDAEILPANTNQAIAIIRVDVEKVALEYIYGYFIGQLQQDFYNYNVQQAVQANLSLTTISSLPVIIPDNVILVKITEIMIVWLRNRNNLNLELRRLEEIKILLLAKMTKLKV